MFSGLLANNSQGGHRRPELAAAGSSAGRSASGSGAAAAARNREPGAGDLQQDPGKLHIKKPGEQRTGAAAGNGLFCGVSGRAAKLTKRYIKEQRNREKQPESGKRKPGYPPPGSVSARGQNSGRGRIKNPYKKSRGGGLYRKIRIFCRKSGKKRVFDGI